MNAWWVIKSSIYKKDFVDRNKIDTSKKYICACIVHPDYPLLNNGIAVNLSYNKLPDDINYQTAVYFDPSILIFEDPNEDFLIEKIRKEYGEKWEQDILALLRYYQLKSSNTPGSEIPERFDFARWLDSLSELNNVDSGYLLVARNTSDFIKLVGKCQPLELAMNRWWSNMFQLGARKYLAIDVYNGIASIYDIGEQPNSDSELLEPGINFIDCTKVQV